MSAVLVHALSLLSNLVDEQGFLYLSFGRILFFAKDHWRPVDLASILEDVRCDR